MGVLGIIKGRDCNKNYVMKEKTETREGNTEWWEENNIK
jgi:hypothetical protein